MAYAAANVLWTMVRLGLAEERITAGTDTCCDEPAVQPNPLKVDAEKLLFFLLWAVALKVVGVSLLEEVLLEKVERSKEEMVDLHLVDWIMEGI